MVVAIAIDPLYFNDFYRTIELGKHDRIFLFHKNGSILALEPFDNKIVGTFLPDYRLISKGSAREMHTGTFHMKGDVLDGTGRIISYWLSDLYPVVSVVSLREHDMLVLWRTRSIKSAGGALLLMALVGTLSLLFFLQIKKFNRARINTA